MYAGLDFGTSNCLLGVIEDQTPTLVPLNNGKNRLPSCLYIPNEVVPPAQLSQQQTLDRIEILRDSKAQGPNTASSQNREVLGSIARHQLRQEHREQSQVIRKVTNILDAMKSGADVILGEQAESLHISQPENGFYIKSPKSFLGADINTSQKLVFTAIVEKMLSFIKQEVESAKQQELDSIVIGRPVNFHGLLGQDGNKQALSIINNAALQTGFKHIEFLMEPVAAAYDYERQLESDATVLVLDLGGGTTDCSMIKIGPSYRHLQNRESCILSHTGKRIGGIDLDNKLALMSLMPYFGKNAIMNNGLPVPNNLFRQAVNVNDVAAQKDFNLPRTGKELDEYCKNTLDANLRRLQTLRDEKLGLRLSRSAEQAKIDLSQHTHIQSALDYIEAGLSVPIFRTEFSESIAEELSKFELLLQEAIKLSGTQPDVLYVTGGTAISPVIQSWIQGIFPDLKIVIGDHFGSVTSGLVTQAQRIMN